MATKNSSSRAKSASSSRKSRSAHSSRSASSSRRRVSSVKSDKTRLSKTRGSQRNQRNQLSSSKQRSELLQRAGVRSSTRSNKGYQYRTGSSRKHNARKTTMISAISVIAWIAIVLIAGWMVLRYLPAGMDARYPFTYLIALIPLLAVPLVIIEIFAIATKNTAQIWVTAILLVIHMLWSLTFYLPMPPAITTILGSPRQTISSTVSTSQTAQNNSHAPTLTVMTVNVMRGRADTSVIMHTIKHEHVDVLAVQEVNDKFVQQLRDNGILQELGFEQLGEKTDHDNAGFNALWSRYPVSETGAVLLKNVGSNTPWITINVDNHPVRIISTHPYSPHRSLSQWHSDISALQQVTTNSDVPSIVMGDLNSSTFHGTFRSVVDAGLVDSSLEIHHGSHTTFPSSWAFVPPLIEIDHVLHTRELRAIDMKTVKIPRTDHQALVTTITWK